MNQITDQQTDDDALLREFVATRDPAAFEVLTRRHAGMVYAAALRQLRDAHLAEDVTQAVFIVLARQARAVRSGAVLPAWLFSVTRHACNNARRVLARRRYHEMRKAAMTEDHYTPATTGGDDADDAAATSPLMDDAIARLSAAERTAVVLRYFAGRTHRQIADVMAISEEASRKRVDR